MSFSAFETKIFNALKEDSLQEAFEILFSWPNVIAEHYAELVISSANYHRIEKAYRQDTINWEVMSQNKSKMIARVVEIIQSVKKNQNNSQVVNFSSNLHDKLDYEDNGYLWNGLKIVGRKKTVKEVKDEKSNGVFRLYLNVPVASLTVRGGNENIEYSQEATEDLVNYMEVEGVSTNAVSFLIIGHSMDPFLKEGQLIICEPYISDNEFTSSNREKLDQLKTQIDRWKRDNMQKVLTVVVQTIEGGTLVKYLKNIDRDHITLASENEQYQDKNIQVSEIKSLWIVKRKINIEEV